MAGAHTYEPACVRGAGAEWSGEEWGGVLHTLASQSMRLV